MNIEHCIVCDTPTGKAGKADDSLYREDATGPYCEDCYGEFDKYGNPINGDRLIHCCFPDCGCDGSRLCMAENGASELAGRCNVEGMWQNGSKKECRRAVFGLLHHLGNEKKDAKP